jgi:RND superfamily putative drug exporter
MFEKLGHFAVRRKTIAVILFVIATLVAGGVGAQVFNRLDSGGYSISSSDSYKVYTYIKDTLKESDPAIVVMVDAGADVNDPTIAARAIALEKKMAAEDGVSKTLSYWSAGGAASLKSSDGKAAYILIYGDGEAFSPKSQELGSIFQKNYDGKVDGFTLYSGGFGVIGNAITEKIGKDLKLADCWSFRDSWRLLYLVLAYFIYRCLCLRSQSHNRYGPWAWNRLRTLDGEPLQRRTTPWKER